eukprot:7688873-Alexandrium_andersonii.AAC.1
MECERPAIRHRSAVAVPAPGQRRNPYTPPRHAGSHLRSGAHMAQHPVAGHVAGASSSLGADGVDASGLFLGKHLPA